MTDDIRNPVSVTFEVAEEWVDNPDADEDRHMGEFVREIAENERRRLAYLDSGEVPPPDLRLAPKEKLGTRYDYPPPFPVAFGVLAGLIVVLFIVLLVRGV